MSARSGLRIAHHHPGRLRVRADAFLDNGPAAEQARVGLVRAHGVRSVAHDPRSGSLLVVYDPRDVDANALVARIAELSGLPLIGRSPRHRTPAAARVVSAVRRIDRATESWSGGRFNLGVLVPAGLTAASVYSFLNSSHARLPRWDNLLYWAYSVFIHAHAEPHRSPP